MNVSQLISLVLTVILVQLNKDGVTACRCPLLLPQEKFCGADFVVRAKVWKVILSYAIDRSMTLGEVSNDRSLVKYIYRVRITKTFKTSDRFKKATKTTMMSISMNRGCGQMLKENGVYLLTGTIINQELWIDGCGWNVKFNSLSTRTRNYLNSDVYSKNCACMIDRCQGEECSTNDVGKDHCVMQIDAWSCFKDYGVCAVKKQTKNGVPICKWHKPYMLKKCLDKFGEHIINKKKAAKSKN